jgi:hypothetical protein
MMEKKYKKEIIPYAFLMLLSGAAGVLYFYGLPPPSIESAILNAFRIRAENHADEKKPGHRPADSDPVYRFHAVGIDPAVSFDCAEYANRPRGCPRRERRAAAAGFLLCSPPCSKKRK